MSAKAQTRNQNQPSRRALSGIGEQAMITVLNGGSLNGYSSTDHLIDDSQIKDIIGRQFRSVGDALRAADRRVFIDGTPSRKRRAHPYTWVQVQMANGAVNEHKSV